MPFALKEPDLRKAMEDPDQQPPPSKDPEGGFDDNKKEAPHTANLQHRADWENVILLNRIIY